MPATDEQQREACPVCGRRPNQRMRAALSGDSRANGEPGPGLDAAWAEAEAALPEGWRLWGLDADPPPDASPLEPMQGHWDWRASAMANDWSAEEIVVRPTPAAALLALATRLRALREADAKEETT